MLNLKGAANKEWKAIATKPVRRKTISTSVEKNTNKRFLKLVKKDARRIQRKNELKNQQKSGKGIVEDHELSEDFEIGSEDDIVEKPFVEKFTQKIAEKTTLLGKRKRTD